MSHKKNENKSRTFNKDKLVITPKETIPVKRDKINKESENSMESRRGKDRRK